MTPVDSPMAQARMEPKRPIRDGLRRAWHGGCRAIYLYVYCRHIYHHHMRLIHRYGYHWFTYIHPYDGEAQDWCQWCGQKKIWLPRIPNSAISPASLTNSDTRKVGT